MQNSWFIFPIHCMSLNYVILSDTVQCQPGRRMQSIAFPTLFEMFALYIECLSLCLSRASDIKVKSVKRAHYWFLESIFADNFRKRTVILLELLIYAEWKIVLKNWDWYIYNNLVSSTYLIFSLLATTEMNFIRFFS